jgi:peptidyl-prolyl cis-trans isomerase A (cyclophilin A)
MINYNSSCKTLNIIAAIILALIFTPGCDEEKQAEQNNNNTAAESKTESKTEAKAETETQQQTAAEPVKEKVVSNPKVQLTTNYGNITIELDSDKAPVTTANFLEYVEKDFYNGTVFHRVIPGFMIQGGGFTLDMNRKRTNPPIKNEASNGLKNNRGTISMARTPNPDSATSQFFINVVDNGPLDYTPANPGYADFGKVTEGMETVDKIAAVQTGMIAGMKDVPVKPVVIESAKVLGSD